MRFSTLCAMPDGASARSFERDCLAQALDAEGQGYASAWLAGSTSSLHVVASAAFARTDRLRIGVASAVPPALHPLRLAEEIAMLDVMSGGRLDWAIGPARGDARAFDEQLAVALRALSGERFSHAGAFFRISELQCFPPPVQAPHPPLWLRADSEAGVAHAEALGRPAMIGPAMPADAAAEALVIRYVHVAATPARARADAEPALGTAGDRAIVGDAAQCRDALAALAEELDLDRLVAWHGFGGLPSDAARASQRRFAEEVAPAFG